MIEQELAISRVETTAMSKKISTLGSQKKELEIQKKLESKVCSLSEKLHGVDDCSSRGRSSTKAYSDYSESHKRRLKRARTQKCEDSLLWLHQEGYTPLAVEMKITSTGRVERVVLKRDELQQLFGTEEEITEENIDVLNMLLLLKDQYHISMSAYHELHKYASHYLAVT